MNLDRWILLALAIAVGVLLYFHFRPVPQPPSRIDYQMDEPLFSHQAEQQRLKERLDCIENKANNKSPNAWAFPC